MRTPARLSIIFILALTLSPVGARADGGDAGWALGVGGAGDDRVNGITVGPDGTSYVIGTFAGTATFGATELTSAGDDDAFVASINGAAGEITWAIAIGGAGRDDGFGIARASDGSLFVTGSFVDDATVGPAPSEEEPAPTVTGTGRHMFIAKLGGDGTVLWARARGGSAGEFPRAIATTGSDDVVVGGSFTGTTSLGGGTIPSNGDHDAFVATYDGEDGRHLWSTSFGSTSFDRVTGVTVTPAGDVVTTGRFNDDMDAGGGTMSPGGAGDPFVIALDGATGTHRWSRVLETTGAANGRGIVAGDGGSIFVVGSFAGSALFTTPSVASKGGRDTFLAKIAPGGGVAWSVVGRGSGEDQLHGVTLDPAGDVGVVGTTAGAGGLNLGGGTLSSGGPGDVVTALFDGTTGAHVWSSVHGGPSLDHGAAAASSPTGMIVTAGWFEGNTTIGEAALSGGGEHGALAAIVGDDVPPVATIATPTNSILISIPGVQTNFITGTTTDDRIGIASVGATFATPVVAGLPTVVQATLSCTDERRSCTWSIEPPAVPGPYEVTVAATDRAGNVEAEPTSITVIII